VRAVAKPAPYGRTVTTDPLTDALRHELLQARRAGDRALSSALRTTLASLANAEAVPAAEDDGAGTTAHVAGGRAGVGAADVPRRALTDEDRLAVVAAEIASLEEAVGVYAELDPARAADARRGAVLLADVLSRSGTAR
jgi:hypothetical protein